PRSRRQRPRGRAHRRSLADRRRPRAGPPPGPFHPADRRDRPAPPADRPGREALPPGSRRPRAAEIAPSPWVATRRLFRCESTCLHPFGGVVLTLPCLIPRVGLSVVLRRAGQGRTPRGAVIGRVPR